MDNLFIKTIVSESIKLKPHELRRGYENTILNHIRESHEGRCTRNGYVMKGSVEIIKISEGRLDTNSLNGSVNFSILFSCQACNPMRGDVVTAAVRNFNRFGVMCTVGVTDRYGQRSPPILSIIVPKQSASGAMQSNAELDDIAVGDKLIIEIVGVKYELNDPKISVLGRALERISTSSEPSKNATAQNPLAASGTDISMRKAQRDAAEDITFESKFEGEEQDPEEDAEASVSAALALASNKEDLGDDEDEYPNNEDEIEDEYEEPISEDQEDDEQDDEQDEEHDNLEDGDGDDDTRSEVSQKSQLDGKDSSSATPASKKSSKSAKTKSTPGAPTTTTTKKAPVAMTSVGKNKQSPTSKEDGATKTEDAAAARDRDKETSTSKEKRRPATSTSKSTRGTKTKTDKDILSLDPPAPSALVAPSAPAAPADPSVPEPTPAEKEKETSNKTKKPRAASTSKKSNKVT